MIEKLHYGTMKQPLTEFIRSIRLVRDEVLMLDQTLLPMGEETLVIRDYRQCIEAIKMLRIRGAPAIGIAAGAAAWLAAMEFSGRDNYIELMNRALDEIEASRPTAVNLFKATTAIRRLITAGNGNRILDYTNKLIEVREPTPAFKMGGLTARRKSRANRWGILTHCNTGSLATVGIGTALGVIRTIARDRRVHVFVDETRPLLQGARLTTWELMQSGIPCTLITDSMAASVMRSGVIDCVITGADRIADNGDLGKQDRHVRSLDPGKALRYTVLHRGARIDHRSPYTDRQGHPQSNNAPRAKWRDSASCAPRRKDAVSIIRRSMSHPLKTSPPSSPKRKSGTRGVEIACRSDRSRAYLHNSTLAVHRRREATLQNG